MNRQCELDSRLLEVLHFATAGLANLKRYAKYWETEEKPLLRRQDKVAAEAVLLAYLASRVPRQHQCLTRAVQDLGEAARSHIVTGRNEALLRRFPQTAVTLGVGHVILAALGRGDPVIEALLRRAVSHGFATLSERSTFRLMDARWTYGLLAPDLAPGPVEELVPLSTLGASPHPIYTMNEDDYALTHALFYLTDFGQRPAAGVTAGSDLLAPFLAWNAVQGDLDLLGEFLIASLVLRQPDSAAARYGRQVFFEAWETSGGLTGPSYSSTHWASLSDEEADAYAFSENYHTVFVGGIMCAVALSTPLPDGGRRPPPVQETELASRCLEAAARSPFCGCGPAPVDRPVLTEWIVSRLLRASHSAFPPAPPWLRAAEACDLSREELTGVLYDALLVSLAKQYALVQLAEALAAGAGRRTLRSGTFIAAAEFLLGQQLRDGFVGIHELLMAGPEQPAEAQAAIAGALKQVGAVLWSDPVGRRLNPPPNAFAPRSPAHPEPQSPTS